MSFFQKPPVTPEEIEASKPLEIPPETVLGFDEAEWYARAYRHDSPQLTFRAVAMGTVLGFFLSFTNVYIGLKTGWFLGVGLTACILSYAIWNGLLSAGLAKTPLSILETTCAVSTASSAGYATGNMVISSIPAMLLLTVTEANPGGTHIRWQVLAPWIFFLAALGVTLAIPMKRSMINREKLKFPSGTAAAVTLQSLYSRGNEALVKARVLFGTAMVSAFVPLLKELEIRKVGIDPKTGKALREALVPGQSNVFDWITNVLPDSWTHRMLNAGPAKLHPGGAPFHLSDYQLKLDHGLALLFAGVIIGLRITGWMVVGGLILAIFIDPIALDWQWTNAAGVTVGAASKPASAWKEIGIWIGAPMLVASGLVSFAAQWRTIVRALASLGPTKRNASAATEGAAISPDQVEVPGSWFIAGMIFSGIGIVVIAWLAFDIPVHLGILAIAMTFVLSLVACRATGESDITPGGPLGKIVQLTYGVLMPQSTTANLQTAAITSGASLASADLLNDLKSGYLLGASPRRQFLAQAFGILTGTVATVLCYFILVPDATVLTGTDTKPPAFPAPSAQQWKAVAEVFKYGLGNLHPMAQAGIKWGIAIGVILALAELYAPKQYKKWIPSPTGIGLGMVLPFFYPLAMFLGALFAAVAERVNKTWAERYLIAIAAGGVAGESIIGVIVQALNNFVLN
ncbi:Oligopeptide transporter, OPT family [Labilithrix luteola]|uniref:Oligopeptide transporter, OPT family n=1 Tax=Labilithrix luteola TaxID=1391654 RepID=A0A0K1QFU4_9BACT|nr:OPT family oligopeptide transporter [Labilithrix luteola]AKV04646.1 Oligopeptide transporter, OPT family [Labilithrix luteola]